MQHSGRGYVHGWYGIVLFGVIAAATPGPARGATSMEERLRVLERLLRQQQEEIEQLRRELQQQKSAGEASGKKAEQAEEQARVMHAEQTRLSLPDWVRKVSLFGDLRPRYEGFFNLPSQPLRRVGARNRERVRARVGVRFTYSDELSATVRAATGSADDPISTNEDLGRVFAAKGWNLDWAYLTLAPGDSFGIRPGALGVTAGKFPNPIFRPTQMVFDEDLAPEGLSQTVALLAAPRGILRQVRLHGLQWNFAEVASDSDGWMIGGQLNPVVGLGRVEIEAGLGHFWWVNADRIAQALNDNSRLRNTNRVVTRIENGEKIVTGYASTFNQSGLSLQATLPNALGARPVRALADFVYNWNAASSEDLGWALGARIGDTREKGDWAVTGLYVYLEQEAAISAFTYSDFELGTNAQGFIVGGDYQLLGPLTLGARSHFTNFIERPARTTNPTLIRLQVDATLRF
jgi:hypothetical protein